jgi:hypothetical protein
MGCMCVEEEVEAQEGWAQVEKPSVERQADTISQATTCSSARGEPPVLALSDSKTARHFLAV